MKLAGVCWLHKLKPCDRPEDTPRSFILLIQAPSPVSLMQSFIFKLGYKPRHLYISFSREQSVTKVTQWWTLPSATVHAVGRDHGMVQRPEPLQTQALQGLCSGTVSPLLRPGTPNTGGWKDLLTCCMWRRGKLSKKNIAKMNPAARMKREMIHSSAA